MTPAQHYDSVKATIKRIKSLERNRWYTIASDQDRQNIKHIAKFSMIWPDDVHLNEDHSKVRVVGL